MPDERAVTTAHLDFVAELNKLHLAAGKPSLLKLRMLSEREYEPGTIGKVVLTRSTTSDILSGKRARMPSWPWVASFVCACRAVIAESRVDPDTLGTVEQWHAKWQAAQAAAELETTGAAASRSSGMPADVPATCPEPPHPQPDDAALEHDKELELELGLGEKVPPAEPSIMLHRYLDAFGRTGARLLRRADSGDAEAAYRLGVLLTCDERPREAAGWLQSASEAGHPKLQPLGAYTPAHATKDAFDLGIEHSEAGQTHAALTFFKRAGQCGHPEAAHLVGLHYAEARKLQEAAIWFSRAMLAGHPWAHREYEAVHQQLKFSGLIPQPPGLLDQAGYPPPPYADTIYPDMPGYGHPSGPQISYAITREYGTDAEPSPWNPEPNEDPLEGMPGPLEDNDIVDFLVRAEEDVHRLPTIDDLLSRIMRERQRKAEQHGRPQPADTPAEDDVS